MVPVRKVAAFTLLGLAFGCGPSGSLVGTGAVAGGPPTLGVDLGTVDPGERVPFQVRVPVTNEVRQVLLGDVQIQPHSSGLRIYQSGFGPGYVEFQGESTAANCVGFATSASVERDGKTVMTLDLKAKVRRAFEITTIARGSKYALKMAPGFAPPTMIDHSAGIAAQIVVTGKDSAALTLTRTRPALVPGGSVRLIDRGSGDNQVLELPVPPGSTLSSLWGGVVDRDGFVSIVANGALTPDKPGVEVVLDPPDVYKIVRRSYEGGKLSLRLRSLTRTPVDLSLGFRRGGKWLEIQRIHPDVPAGLSAFSAIP